MVTITKTPAADTSEIPNGTQNGLIKSEKMTTTL